MTHPLLALDSATHVLPDGRILFSDLHFALDARRTGLVGRNGVGKSVFARLLAGELTPSAGRCVRHGRLHYVPQQIAPAPHATVADLAGVGAALRALARIEAGSADVADFDALGERWDIAQRLQAQLHAHDLGALEPQRLAATLSGGEAMRVALIGAWLADADVLILDEPTLHLDAAQRQRLREALQRWPGGLLVISHDALLLQDMQRTLELSPGGLRDYGGDYAFYLQCRARERDAAQAELAQHKLQHARDSAAWQAQHDRQQRRSARGRQQAGTANQAPILLGRQKQRSQDSAGKRLRDHQATQARSLARIAEAVRQVQPEAPVALFAPPPTDAASRRLVELQALQLPFAPATRQPLDLVVHGGARIGVVGANGSGKSTLLRALAGQVAALSGTCRVHAASAYLDQSLASLDPAATALAQVQAVAPGLALAELRMRLALLGLDAPRIGVACGQLSGGERLKTALACAFYRTPPAELLLLDEPDNHLDREARDALRAVLLQYPGALLVVSHDAEFLDTLRLQQRLQADAEAWRLTPW
ncbi:ABC transporter ATP-binding protein [Xanthomonas sp. NCPPB 1128]|uniref:ABC-F family ATP-binding cassette domain-containing protein n=1 Tax=Xanthomonas sp. NCPPB 1128 TaxID=1775876 RepID=UPI00065ACAB8|nr:ABC-F family ATP-binding cassette domain-containing protein [Xanthomonas sp. NCPPB 1128]KMM74372.1 ABC transporter ATP-binding protein [Xanthomonas sp. NCPPB 1128]